MIYLLQRLNIHLKAAYSKHQFLHQQKQICLKVRTKVEINKVSIYLIKHRENCPEKKNLTIEHDSNRLNSLYVSRSLQCSHRIVK